MGSLGDIGFRVQGLGFLGFRALGFRKLQVGGLGYIYRASIRLLWGIYTF